MSDNIDDPARPIGLENQGSFFFIAMSMLLSRNENSIIPESLYFLEPDQILKLAQTYGGSRVYIPTPKEIGMELLGALAAYYRFSRGMSWDVIQEKLRVDGRTMNGLKTRITEWQEKMTELGVDTSDALLYTQGAKP